MGHGGRGPNIPLRRELDIEERVARAMKSSVRLLGKQVARDNMINVVKKRLKRGSSSSCTRCTINIKVVLIRRSVGPRVAPFSREDYWRSDFLAICEDHF